MLLAVTRPRERAEETVELLRSKGFEPLIVPGLRLVPREEKEVREEIGRIEDYHWLLVTSAFGAELMHKYYGEGLNELSIAVVGKKTEETFSRLGVRVDLVPGEFKAERLAEELLKQGIRGKRILLARASAGRKLLVERLSLAEVRDVVLYDSLPPREGPLQEMKEKALSGELKGAIFTSSLSAKNILARIGDKKFIKALNNITVVAIAPATRKALQEWGLERVIMPEVYSVESCLNLMEESWRNG